MAIRFVLMLALSALGALGTAATAQARTHRPHARHHAPADLRLLPGALDKSLGPASTPHPLWRLSTLPPPDAAPPEGMRFKLRGARVSMKMPVDWSRALPGI